MNNSSLKSPMKRKMIWLLLCILLIMPIIALYNSGYHHDGGYFPPDSYLYSLGIYSLLSSPMNLLFVIVIKTFGGIYVPGQPEVSAAPYLLLHLVSGYIQRFVIVPWIQRILQKVKRKILIGIVIYILCTALAVGCIYRFFDGDVSIIHYDKIDLG